LKALIQRVGSASVRVNDKNIGTIGSGLLIFIGIFSDDSINDIRKISNKIINLRIFNDFQEKMNKSILDVKGEILLVSQFTLCSDTKKGNRPSFNNAMDPDSAINLFNSLKDELSKLISVKVGKFGENMDVSLVNEGPVTIMLDTKNENK
jgi:D-tyrosyl-tRNA(Tyr) deacylase